MCAMPCPPLRRECPKLTQEEFDEAVRTNIEDFDMEAEEAVKAAVEEFTLQNYDMGCVVKTAAGKELANHPVALATVAISEAKTNEDKAAAFAQLQGILITSGAEGPEKLQEVGAVALRSGSLAAVMRSIQAASGMDAKDSAQGPVDASLLLAPLSLAKQLMAVSLDIRDSFDDVKGAETVMHLHKQHPDHMVLQAELARMAECACFKEEQNKEQLMLAGYGLGLAELLQQDPRQLTEDLVASASGVLRAVCTADDDRPPTSKAFQHARLLAHENQALKTLLSLLKGIMAGWKSSSSEAHSSAGAGAAPPAPKPTTSPSSPESSAPTVSAMLACMRQLAASEDICKSFSEEGGVLTILALIARLHSKQHRDVVRSGLGALRQLSNSDGTKLLLAAHDAPTTLLQCAASHPRDEDVAELVLGVLAAITLRQPAIATQCAEAGVIDWVTECLTDMASSPLVCRQACILMRNMVVRNPELRPAFLEKGADRLVRAAKTAHPPNCKDVGSAALRDLGLDNYSS
uniref:Armadillo repeat-containing protein 8 n=1 Tax=Dunaliella tertiolecta TaxID=3047 RepID=A0A7S3VJY0_DUNTE|mmetsp:Transcript_6517/g.15656  ORF Transcript_6517/g.15656 Transcript_6517/m.15656 type:complete len:519 (+) Transcript_6517:1499-3055(+)|eukprot:CAMPEP_0202373228 /NCGR_PEP_ID=MMETSP1127-20130417/4279_1 /ASSEMBLY_ACC=CAM_ASM_000462 /TAXON_ID=3047 /ORGANISM="Dunaliella tertiolecta, Strain CCMP1320" /LENGTH=518 /DNA_ID=CAMNT_0048970033 /DNA_START=1460 /DNA_END=3016 /DNA_ORIENTATION=+